MTNAEKLLRELTDAGRRGCTHRELSAAGVTHITIEVARLRERGAVVDERPLPVSGQRRYVLLVAPSEKQAEEPPEPEGVPLFDPPAAEPASHYNEAA